MLSYPALILKFSVVQFCVIINGDVQTAKTFLTSIWVINSMVLRIINEFLTMLVIFPLDY